MRNKIVLGKEGKKLECEGKMGESQHAYKDEFLKHNLYPNLSVNSLW